MTRDIVVTTPKQSIEIAAEEAEYCIKNKFGYYFRVLNSSPKNVNISSKVFYVEDGYVRGFAEVFKIHFGQMTCEITGKIWKGNCILVMSASSWCWIKPIKMKGFQGYRYFNQPVEIVGNWLDPKPKILLENQ